MTVSKEGTTTKCSYSNKVTPWCTHEGDAYFMNTDERYYTEDDTYYDTVTSESIVIPDAVNGTFEFSVYHDFLYDWQTYDDDYYKYYGQDMERDDLAAQLKIWVNGKERKTQTHDVDIHLGDNSFFVDMTCDADCKCNIKKRDTPHCVIEARMDFPSIEDAPYYGYHNDL